MRKSDHRHRRSRWAVTWQVYAVCDNFQKFVDPEDGEDEDGDEDEV